MPTLQEQHYQSGNTSRSEYHGKNNHQEKSERGQLRVG